MEDWSMTDTAVPTDTSGKFATDGATRMAAAARGPTPVPDSGFRPMFGQQRPTLEGIAAQILELPHIAMMQWARDLKAASTHVGSNEYDIAQNLTDWCERIIKEAKPS
jgi:hypothetical protein